MLFTLQRILQNKLPRIGGQAYITSPLSTERNDSEDRCIEHFFPRRT